MQEPSHIRRSVQTTKETHTKQLLVICQEELIYSVKIVETPEDEPLTANRSNLQATLRQ